MGKFDFITDEQFRNSLECDATEVSKCIEGKAWKAVHVLVGSMIEALLMDHLLATGFKGGTKTELLNMNLGQLIGICGTERVAQSWSVTLRLFF